MALHRYFNKSKGTFVFTLRWNPNTTVIVIKIFREPLWEECWKGPRKKTTFIIETGHVKVFTTNIVSLRVFTDAQVLTDKWGHCKVTNIRSSVITVLAKVTLPIHHDAISRNLKIKCMINTVFPNFPKH